MSKDNLPLELFNKHLEALGLANPTFFEHENQLFAENSAPIQDAVVFLPKSKPLINMTLALVSGMVAENGVIILAGTNDGGIRSAKEAYEKNIGPVDQKIVGNHSALYVGRNKKLGAGKKVEDFLSFSPLSYKDTALEVANMPGVFNGGALDEGTRLLLGHIPYDRAKILDIGCGSGIIGSLYKKISPASDVTMTDSTKLAVLATKETIQKNGIEATVGLSDVFSNISGTFDLILTNPPFHKGLATDYTFIEAFARGVKKHLNKNGEIWLVANSFLPYKEILEKHVGPTEIVIDTKKFRVYRTTAR